jgi:hypothetical protein
MFPIFRLRSVRSPGCGLQQPAHISWELGW